MVRSASMGLQRVRRLWVAIRWGWIFLMLVPALGEAHPFGSTYFAQQTTLKLEPAQLRVEYVIEVPTSVVMREFYEALEGRAPSREEDALYTEKKLAALFSGLQVTIDGQPLELVNVTDPKRKNGVGNMNFFVYRLDAQAAWAPGAGSAHRIMFVNQNYPDSGTYYNQQIWASDALEVTGSSLWRDGGGEIATDNAGRWLQSPAVRDFTVDVKVVARSGGTPVPVRGASAPKEPENGATSGDANRAYYVPKVEGVPLLSYLGRVDLSLTVVLVAFGMALFLGAAHALSPGHGKTLVAAYLVGSRGTVRHAILLGLVVTLAHTSSVMLLGVVTLFAQKYILPERLMTYLGVASGLAIVFIGVWMLVNRWRQREKSLMARVRPVMSASMGGALPAQAHAHGHGDRGRHSHGSGGGHEHAHGVGHSAGAGENAAYDYDYVHYDDEGSGGERMDGGHPWPGHAAAGHDHAGHTDADHTHMDHAHGDHSHRGHSHHGHRHDEQSHHGDRHDAHSHHGHAHVGHSHGGLMHSHWGGDDAHDHAHEMPENLKPGQLVRLGVAGGLVPCPMATVVLLTAVALHRLAFGLALIVAFSLGLGAVLVLIGILIVLARSYVERFSGDGWVLRYLPIASAVIVTVYGVGITVAAWMEGAGPLTGHSF